MDKLDLVLSLRRYGARLHFVEDYWGNEHVRVSAPVTGWPRLTVKLEPDEMRALKSTLRSGRGTSPAQQRRSA